MKKLCLMMGCWGLAALICQGQGQFLFLNSTALTRLGSIDGPLAGPGIWAQMLAGPDASSLTPVGMPLEHVTNNGFVGGLVRVSVPSVSPPAYASVQMVAWDGVQWGTDLANVPADRLGRTDVVQVLVTSGMFPDIIVGPSFTQPAIVPIPEPSAWALAALGTVAAWLARRRRHRSPPS